MRTFDLSSAQLVPLRIESADYDSYIAVMPADGNVQIRLGSINATPYNLAAIPLRRSSVAYGEVFLSWNAQEGELLFILGRNEDAGIR